jgi:hypothetical protein
VNCNINHFRYTTVNPVSGSYEFVLQLPAVELRSSAERSDLMSSNALAAQRTESAQLAALAKSIVADEPAAWSC